MRVVRTSPHIHGPLRTDKAMLFVIIALCPAALWGVWAFGLRALLVIAVSIAASVLTEYLLGLVSKEFTLRDYSAVVTGLLIGMNMPPSIPLYIPVIASAFAMAVVKWTFGGLGCNWMNPALAGRVFVFFSFTSQMSTFTPVRWMQLDAVSSATPLSALKTAAASGAVGTSSELLSAAGLPVSDIAASLASSSCFRYRGISCFLNGTLSIFHRCFPWQCRRMYRRGFRSSSACRRNIPHRDKDHHMENSCSIPRVLCSSFVDLRRNPLWERHVRR